LYNDGEIKRRENFLPFLEVEEPVH